MGLWLGFSAYSVFKMVQSASYAWGSEEVVLITIITIITTIIIVVNVRYCKMFQKPFDNWATGTLGRFLKVHLSLIVAALVTLVFLALGGVFIFLSLDVW